MTHPDETELAIDALRNYGQDAKALGSPFDYSSYESLADKLERGEFVITKPGEKPNH